MEWKFSNKLFAVSSSALLCVVSPCFQNGTVLANANSNITTTLADIQVAGTVTSSADGSPLPGVTVMVKGGTTGTVTGMDGKFKLSVPKDATLVFSYISFVTQEVPVNGRALLNIKLALDNKMLDEVVVIGYGVQKKGDVTSSVASVKQEDFIQGAVRDAAQLVQGKVAGLRITTPSGSPTATTQINLRGINSINGATNPLVLIDGVPGNLNTVAPEDIESVDVLKDGSAAAIYGTRATGGVILITTRKNRGDARNTIEYNSYVNMQTIARRPNLLNGDDYRRLKAEGIKYEDFGGNTDWLDEIFRNPVSHNHNLTFNGGTSTTNFTGSINYRNWQGLMLRSGNERITARADLNHSMFNDKLRANIQIINRNNTTVGSTNWNYAYRQAFIRNPTDRVRTETGEWQERNGFNYENPVALLHEQSAENVSRQMRMSGSLMYSPINDLNIKVLASHVYDNSTSGNATTFNHTATRLGRQNGTASRGASSARENLLELTSNYSKTIGRHRVTLLGGYSWQDEVNEGFSMSNLDFPTDVYGWNNIGRGAGLQQGRADMGSYKNKWQLAGFFGRVSYSWQDKYLLMASVRREGSSKFGENYKWGSFPAVSAGWRVSKEPFMQDISIVNDLKLRGGFGVTGTIANNAYQSQISYNFSQGQGAYMGGKWVQGFMPVRNFNPDLRWERKEEYNAGVDFALFNNRITGAVDVYQRYVKDLLYNFQVPTPPYLFGSIMTNAGTLKNEGIEVLVNFAAIQKKDFQWNWNLTYSSNRNKLVSLSNEQFKTTNDFFNAGGTGEPVQDYTHRVVVGEPIGRFFVWKTVGVDADGRFLIENKDGEVIPINKAKQEDRQFYGNGIPKHIMGWNHSFRYKSVDLNVTMRGAFGHHILNYDRMFYENPKNPAYNMLKNAYDPVYGQRLNNDLVYVSHYIEKGDYLKVDNVTLGYTLPSNLFGFIKNSRVYVSALNLATITGYKGIDPEGVDFGGFSPGNDNRDKFPTTTTFTSGLNLTF